MKTFWIIFLFILATYVNYLLNIDKALSKMVKDSVLLSVKNVKVVKRFGRSSIRRRYTIEFKYRDKKVLFAYNGDISIKPDKRKDSLKKSMRIYDNLFIEITRLQFKGKTYYCFSNIYKEINKEEAVSEDLYLSCMRQNRSTPLWEMDMKKTSEVAESIFKQKND